MTNWLLVFIGGGLGSLARFAVGQLFGKYWTVFPFGTFAANVAACFLFGAAVSLFQKGVLSDGSRLFLLTGFCGGFSTFSSFSGETVALLHNSQPGMALLNIGASFVACLIAVWLGLRMFAA